MYKPADEGITDEALVRGVLRSEEEAFRLLIRRYEKLVISIVTRMLKRREDQEDICQEVFLKVYHNIGNFRFGSKLSTWIGSIAFNACVNFLNKKGRVVFDMPESSDNDDSSGTFEYKDEGAQPDKLLIDKERNRLLWQCVSELPAVQQIILSLFHKEEMKLDEIAEIMNMPVGTIKSHLHRARQTLRTKLLK